jgi:hypothetical protein
MTKKNNCATVIVTAVCGLFAFVATVDVVGWRVIAEDPKFPTDVPRCYVGNLRI